MDEGALEEGLERRRTATDDVPSNVAGNGGVSRQRSLSGTLGELWRGISGNHVGGEGRERDVEREG